MQRRRGDCAASSQPRLIGAGFAAPLKDSHRAAQLVVGLPESITLRPIKHFVYDLGIADCGKVMQKYCSRRLGDSRHHLACYSVRFELFTPVYICLRLPPSLPTTSIE